MAFGNFVLSTVALLKILLPYIVLKRMVSHIWLFATLLVKATFSNIQLY